MYDGDDKKHVDIGLSPTFHGCLSNAWLVKLHVIKNLVEKKRDEANRPYTQQKLKRTKPATPKYAPI